MVFFIAEIYQQIMRNQIHKTIFIVLTLISVSIQLIGFLLYDGSDPDIASINLVYGAPTHMRERQLVYYLIDIRPVICTPGLSIKNITCSKYDVPPREYPAIIKGYLENAISGIR
jgi:hypothetical protein